MLQAMIDGQRDPKVLAEMAHGVMRRRIPQLRQALTGHFDDHHAFICATMLRRSARRSATPPTASASFKTAVNCPDSRCRDASAFSRAIGLSSTRRRRDSWDGRWSVTLPAGSIGTWSRRESWTPRH